MSRPDDIVGHKTFDTGERGEDGFPKFRHEPLTRAEADALWESAQREKQARAEAMPDEQTAIKAFWSAYQRLKELGWGDAIYCPKDGGAFRVIEVGSTGIFECRYSGKWPDGSWDVYDGGDVWPSRPVLYRLYPEDEAREKQRWAEARAKWQELHTTPESAAK